MYRLSARSVFVAAIGWPRRAGWRGAGGAATGAGGATTASTTGGAAGAGTSTEAAISGSAAGSGSSATAMITTGSGSRASTASATTSTSSAGAAASATCAANDAAVIGASTGGGGAAAAGAGAGAAALSAIRCAAKSPASGQRCDGSASSARRTACATCAGSSGRVSSSDGAITAWPRAIDSSSDIHSAGSPANTSYATTPRLNTSAAGASSRPRRSRSGDA
jgi:hypothetical protein